MEAAVKADSCGVETMRGTRVEVVRVKTCGLWGM